MVKFKLLLAFCGFASIQVFATEPCSDNFTSTGGFFKGTTYKTWAEVEGVNSADAFKNIYLQTVKDGWKILSSDKDLGIISAAQDVSYGNGKSAPLNIIVEKVNANSKISITYSTSGGVSSPEKAVIESFCKTIAAAKQ